MQVAGLSEQAWDRPMYSLRGEKKVLAQHIATLEALISLEEEAHDPDGTLTGLYVALAEAKTALQSSAGATERMQVEVYAKPHDLPVLSGLYEGREGVFEGFSTLLLTVMDLWDSGEPTITINITR